MNLFNDVLTSATEHLRAQLAQNNLPYPKDIDWNRIPLRDQWGFGTPVGFQVAAVEKQREKDIDVKTRADEIASLLADDFPAIEGVASVRSANGYLNLILSTDEVAQQVIQAANHEKTAFGNGQGKQRKVMIEYSQPNTHKAMHVGHLRNLVLGGAMANILEFAGNETVRANYIGDIGWHVIKWMWGYLKFHKDETPTGDKTRWMQSIYEEATQKIEENEENEAEARQLFKAWEAKRSDLVELWETTRQWSLDGFDLIYQEFDEEFDIFFFESEFEASGKELVEQLVERGLAIDERLDDGPVVAKLDDLLGEEKENYRTLVLLRSDGTSLYATKELPLAIRKFDEWKIQESIYVIDVRQSLYLRQLFKLLELMGYEQGKDCFHLSYEIVNLPGNVTMSSREGAVVYFDDLIREAINRAARVVEEKNPDLTQSEKELVSRSVGLGAIKYAMLSVDNNKVVTFVWDRALDVEGQAAPYIQYAHVRASSILRQASGFSEVVRAPQYELHPAEIELIDLLSEFGEVVQRSAAEFKPLAIATYAYDLAKGFTTFYQSCPVLKASVEEREFRLQITEAARQTLENSLRLLGIESPSVM